MSEAYAKWPEHEGHQLGYSTLDGKPSCKTCGHVRLSNEATFPIAPDEDISPFWTAS